MDLSRNIIMLGEEKQALIKNSSVLLFGLGGVGGAAAEALARCGIGRLGLVDFDTVEASNLNRQIISTKSNIGMEKTLAAKERLSEISDCQIELYPIFFDESSKDEIDFSSYDYVIDAIDSLDSKVLIAKICKEENKRLISCMGTGNKLDPFSYSITDIFKTHTCPLARRMRKRLKSEGIYALDVLFSSEEPIKTGISTPGSISFMPPVAGMMLASYVVRKILEVESK